MKMQWARRRRGSNRADDDGIVGPEVKKRLKIRQNVPETTCGSETLATPVATLAMQLRRAETMVSGRELLCEEKDVHDGGIAVGFIERRSKDPTDRAI